MMPCKTKSEILSHILGYQFWAVTERLSQRVSLEIDEITKAQRCRRERRLPLKNIPPK